MLPKSNLAPVFFLYSLFAWYNHGPRLMHFVCVLVTWIGQIVKQMMWWLAD